MILEGIVTTLDTAGNLNVAPMGPVVDESMRTLHLRPFSTSQTYRNLQARPCGVFHVTDDVLLLAQTAIGRPPVDVAHFEATKIPGRVLQSTCRWYEFEVASIDDTRERIDIHTRVVHCGRMRDFFGFNRAKHAVVEAAILATRVHLLSRLDILAQFDALAVPVEKTAGPQERQAFELLKRYVTEHTHPTSPV